METRFAVVFVVERNVIGNQSSVSKFDAGSEQARDSKKRREREREKDLKRESTLAKSRRGYIYIYVYIYYM